MTTEERLLRLENAFTTLVGLQRGLEERFDTHEKWIQEMGAAQVELTKAQARTEQALTELAEAQAHTDRRLDVLIDFIQEGRDGKS